jgi:hypothetical protein
MNFIISDKSLKFTLLAFCQSLNRLEFCNRVNHGILQFILKILNKKPKFQLFAKIILLFFSIRYFNIICKILGWV